MAGSAVLDVVFADDVALESSVVEIDGIPVKVGATLTVDGAPLTRTGPLVGLAPGPHVLAETAEDTAGNLARAEVGARHRPTHREHRDQSVTHGVVVVDHALQGAPFDDGHGEPGLAIGEHTEVVDGHDVGML